LKYIDLFSGIGGFHLACEKNGFELVMACEKNEKARQTYIENFGNKYDLKNEKIFPKDITLLNVSDVPDFNVLCAGFPCQAFSRAGKQKGFEDTRGTLFFDVARILKAKQPEYFILENVANLLKHDKGKTFEVISNTLKELGYYFEFKILKLSDYGLPQFRPRIYIIGAKNKDVLFFPEPKELKYNMSHVLNGKCNREIGFTLRVGGRKSPILDRHNWDGYIVEGNEVRLSIDQAKKMQGFPSDFIFNVSENQAMKQLGNSVSPEIIDQIIKSFIF
jgi:DNA (cytosine-5)-methyltransferase 1